MNGKSFTKLLGVLGVLLLVWAICNLASVHAGVGVPKLINFEGKLTETDGTPIKGTKEMTFRIYDSAEAPSPIWVEEREVTVDNGFYSILLGSVESFDPHDPPMKFDTGYWLGVEVSGEGELKPRYQIGAAPYAINADMLDGKDSMEIIPSGVIVMWSGTLANIPSGWHLCNGEERTPDLRDRFILGASEGEDPGEKGGAHSITLSVAQLPPHRHSGTTDVGGAHYHGLNRHTYGAGNIRWSAGNGSDAGSGLPSDGAHTHTFTTASTGLGAPIDNRPAYYKLAYIMKL
ncbi:hypothetical protein ES705_19652 [subsurface metagenome]